MRKNVLIRCYLIILTAGFVLLGFLYWQSLESVKRLVAHVVEQENNKRKLTGQLGTVEARLAVKQYAYDELKKSIEQRTTENYDLVRQLDFYRLILEKKNNKKGVSLNNPELKRTGQSTADLSLTLINFNEKHEILKGRVDLSVSGVQNGLEKTYEIDQLVVKGSHFQQKISFRFYYIAEASLDFPQGFTPLKLHVSAQFGHLKLNQWQQTIDLTWEQ